MCSRRNVAMGKLALYTQVLVFNPLSGLKVQGQDIYLQFLCTYNSYFFPPILYNRDLQTPGESFIMYFTLSQHVEYILWDAPRCTARRSRHTCRCGRVLRSQLELA